MKKALCIVAGLLVCILTGCTQIEEPIPVQGSRSVATAPQTRAGATPYETLPDPYALENMQAVYNFCGVNTTLQATDLYVRFRPQDSIQLNTFEETYNLDLFDHPLDVNIPNGAEYVDPTIPEGEPIWYYTTVKPSFIFPADIPFEVIRSCYIPADDEVLDPPGTRVGESELVAVELLALQRLGYEVEPETRSGGGGGRKPAGHVRVWDNANNSWEAVKGVRVKVNSFTKIDLNAYTNEAGYYQTSKKFWQKNVNYTVVFHNQTKDFWIWEGLGNRAKYQHGSHSKYGCDIDLSNTTKWWQWAAVNNAAWDYYEMCRLEGIAKPPFDLKIWVQLNNGGSSASMIRRVTLEEIGFQIPVIDPVFNLLGLKPDLTIGTSNANYRRIYYLVNHELSHASHFSKVGSTYWARYINYIIRCFTGGQSTYGDGTKQDAGVCEVGEMWGHAMGHIEESEIYDTGRREGPYILSFERTGDNDWIHPDPIWALITRGVLTKNQVFNCLTSDVDTKAKLVTKMTSMYPTKANAIVTAFAHDDVPTITGGPLHPALNTNVTYSVQTAANLSNGFVFNGWTLSKNSGYTVTGGTLGRNLTIKFTSGGIYTLSANFTLPNNSGTYSVTKTVNVDLPLPPPTISYSITENQTIDGRGYVTIFVNNPQPGRTYEWEINGNVSSYSGHSLTFLSYPIFAVFAVYAVGPFDLQSAGANFRCRGWFGNAHSSWSNSVFAPVDPAVL